MLVLSEPLKLTLKASSPFTHTAKEVVQATPLALYGYELPLLEKLVVTRLEAHLTGLEGLHSPRELLTGVHQDDVALSCPLECS
jgi:hypothetical protein